MSVTVISAPAVEPLTATDPTLREHLRLYDDTDQDLAIDAYCQTARAQLEAFLRRRLIDQSLRWVTDGFSELIMPLAPVSAITSIEYLDDASAWQTVNASIYRVIDSESPIRIATTYGQTWPVPQPVPANVRVTFTAGYGAAASDVPADLMQALRLQVAYLYDGQRGDGKAAEGLCVPAQRMAEPHIVWI